MRGPVVFVGHLAIVALGAWIAGYVWLAWPVPPLLGPQVGQEGVLDRRGSVAWLDTALLARDPSDLGMLPPHPLLPSDIDVIWRPIVRGKEWDTAPMGSRVRVLGTLHRPPSLGPADVARVRVLGGPAAGREGWVPQAWIRTQLLPWPAAAPPAEIVSAEIGPSTVRLGETITVKVTVRNTSDKPLRTQRPPPGFAYTLGESFRDHDLWAEAGALRIAVGTDGVDSAPLPYRWGLGGELAPGATMTVTGAIRATRDFGPIHAWAALVEEPEHVLQYGAGLAEVAAVAEDAEMATVAVDWANVCADPYPWCGLFAQVGRGTPLRVLGESGEWARVRLPDTRQGWVRADGITPAAP